METNEFISDEWRWYDGSELPLEGRSYADAGRGETYYDRIPKQYKDAVTPAVWELQKHTAGFCFRFKTASSKLRIFWKPRFPDLHMWHMPSTGMSGIDVYQYGEKRGWQFVMPPWPAPPSADGAGYTWAVVPGAPVTIYLPLYNGISDFRVGVEPGTSIEALPVRKSGIDKPVVIYGTSTTQGGCVSRPGLCWTAVAGRLADVPVVNLGFSGSGRMEDAMVDVVAEIESSLYVLDTIGNMNQDDIRERYERFVRALRDRRPDTPVLVTANGWIYNVRHHECAELIKGIAEKLKAEDPVKWSKLFFAGDYGDDIGPDGEGTMDGVHLNDLGSRRVGEVFGRAIRKILGGVDYDSCEDGGMRNEAE